MSINTGGLPTLYSHGQPVTYSVLGNVLTASVGATTVFTLTVNANGSWAFDLRDQLDHVAGGGENAALRTSANGSTSVSSIDFSSIITATDADGDTVTGAAQGAFTITVQDDVPVQNTGATPVSATVEEDGMSVATGDLSEGNKQGGDTDADDETSGAPGSLSGLFSAGADEPLAFGVSINTGGLPTLYSHGQPVTYSVLGNVLTASSGRRRCSR